MDMWLFPDTPSPPFFLLTFLMPIIQFGATVLPPLSRPPTPSSRVGGVQRSQELRTCG